MQILNNTEWKTLNHDLRLSSLQCGLSSASDRSLTPPGPPGHCHSGPALPD